MSGAWRIKLSNVKLSKLVNLFVIQLLLLCANNTKYSEFANVPVFKMCYIATHTVTVPDFTEKKIII